MSARFTQDLLEKLEDSHDNNWRDNWDYRRFGWMSGRPLTIRIKTAIKGFLQTIGLRPNHVLADLNAHEEQLQWLYERLQDAESRHLLIELMAYRALGYRKVKLPLNSPAYWQKLDALEREAESGDPIELDFRKWKLNRYDLSDEGYPIQVYARASGVFTQLVLQQYRCVTADHCIEVGAGETVIDAGGCYGDTALYFAHKTGIAGRVLSFEFMPNNLTIFQSNLALNPDLANCIQIVPNPLWSSSNSKLFVEGVGPAARVTSTPRNTSSTRVETLCIDDLVQREQLERVDFIKMDIEGAELEALKGAEAVIQRDRPKLAISVYHKLHDFWTIPLWIDSLGLGYRFYLRHFTIHAEETVLFAEAGR
jgi:FkbM family methyltransferase